MIDAVDLFAGGGGLSVGLTAAGAHVVAAVDADPDAVATHRANHSATRVHQLQLAGDTDLAKIIGARPTLLAGGPPCQGWSTLGHRSSVERRLRNNAGIAVFLAQVQALKPQAVLLENVRGFALAERGRRLDELLERLRGLGYVAGSRLLRAGDHGVPQVRHRLFVVAARRELGIEPRFPEPLEEPSPTVWDAVGDLPALNAGQAAGRYAIEPATALQRRLRGGEKSLTLHHAPKHSEAMRRIMAALPKEIGRREDLPECLLPSSGFHNTYKRMRSDRPAPPVTSSIGRVSSGPHVHPLQDRALTPREAARLQTFPDSYQWKTPGRWAAYTLIGNAVPPTLAEAVARPLVAELERALGLPAAARGGGRRYPPGAS